MVRGKSGILGSKKVVTVPVKPCSRTDFPNSGVRFPMSAQSAEEMEMKLLCMRLQSQGFFVTHLAHDQDCANISIARNGFPGFRKVLDFAHVNVSFFLLF